jgi:hypothetical protein
MIPWSFVRLTIATFATYVFSYYVSKLSPAKSLLVPVGNVDNVVELAVILGCGTSSLPLKYLGMPLGVCYKVKSIWDGIVVKMERLLASWKMLYLSKGGRVTFIKSTLSNLPTYLSLFPIPTRVANRIEKLKETFYGVE